MIDLTKPVQTRNGRKARILATDVKRIDGQRLAVAVETSPDSEIILYYRPDGTNTFPSDRLVNVPERVSVFGAVFKDGSFGSGGYCLKNPSSADTIRKNWRAVSVRDLEVVFEDGVPVDAIIHKGS